jgi:DNA modification methylase
LNATAADIAIDDARILKSVRPRSVDVVLTSPPYLNAIDYLRGHRLALTWLGWRIPTLKRVRSGAIGAERAADDPRLAREGELSSVLSDARGRLSSRKRGWIERYLIDMDRVMRALARVARPGATVVLVVGNSTLDGVFVRTADALVELAEMRGFSLTNSSERSLPPGRRYLPPPVSTTSTLSKRMRTESVLRFIAAYRR